MPADQPTLADVLARLDDVDRVLSAEIRANHAEIRLGLVELRRQIHDLEHSMRDLWTEHLGHTHPTDPA